MATIHPDMIADLEVTLIGTRADLTAAHRALSAIGTVTHLGELHPAERPDTGRWLVYLRLAVRAQIAAPRSRRAKPAPAGSAPLPLAG
jgi:hypothetical protein